MGGLVLDWMAVANQSIRCKLEEAGKVRMGAPVGRPRLIDLAQALRAKSAKYTHMG
jgi:hypothetical protein